MRKGILSLSTLGRRKAGKKTVNMETAEKAAARMAEEKTEPMEKPFVQTVTVPRPLTAKGAKAKKTPSRARKPQRKS